MRVVAGAAGGLHLAGAPTPLTRPTTDKVREAVGNALESMGCVEGASVVDLFAGTGACGIEMLSRGARSATFVENDLKAISTINENLRKTALSGTVVRNDVMRFLETMAPGKARFDVAFVDPPYEFASWEGLLTALGAGIAVCESNRPVTGPDGWKSLRERRYGDTTVTIMERT